MVFNLIIDCIKLLSDCIGKFSRDRQFRPISDIQTFSDGISALLMTSAARFAMSDGIPNQTVPP